MTNIQKEDWKHYKRIVIFGKLWYFLLNMNVKSLVTFIWNEFVTLFMRIKFMYMRFVYFSSTNRTRNPYNKSILRKFYRLIQVKELRSECEWIKYIFGFPHWPNKIWALTHLLVLWTIKMEHVVLCCYLTLLRFNRNSILYWFLVLYCYNRVYLFDSLMNE